MVVYGAEANDVGLGGGGEGGLEERRLLIGLAHLSSL